MADREPLDPRRLAHEGWQRRTLACEPRLGEVVQAYRDLGYEVLLVPVLQECAAEGGTGSCTACFAADQDPERYRVVYTRRRAGDGAEAKEFLE